VGSSNHMAMRVAWVRNLRMTFSPSHHSTLDWLLLGSSLAGCVLAAALGFAALSEANRHPERTETSAANQGPRTPHLVVQNFSAAINTPLPLGIVLKDSSGGETLVLSDLIERTTLSAGTPLSSTRWSVPGRDLDKAFIAAPENFIGGMQVTATLYSADNVILETKNIRFTWSVSKAEDRTGSTDLTKAAPPEIPDLAADGNAATRSSNGIAAIADHGADAPPTSGHSEASAPSSRLIPLAAAHWLSQISSFPLPPDYQRIAQKPLAPPWTSLALTPAALLERGERLLRERM
jgi:hypothetical protein